MKLNDALDLSNRRMANGRLMGDRIQAMGATDNPSVIYIAIAQSDGKVRLHDFKLLSDFPPSIQQDLTDSDEWEPRFPLHPLEALAREAEDGQES